MAEAKSDPKKITIKNVAHGYVSRAFDQGMEEVHQNIMRMPTGEHTVSIKINIQQDKNTGAWKLRPTIKVGTKKTTGGPGDECLIMVNEDGIFQVQAGRQLRIDDSDDEE